MPVNSSEYDMLHHKIVNTPKGEIISCFGLGIELFIEPTKIKNLILNLLSVQEDFYDKFSPYLKKIIFCTEEDEDVKVLKLTSNKNPIPRARELIGNRDTKYSTYENVIYGDFKSPDLSKDTERIAPWLSRIMVMPQIDNELSYYASYLPIFDGHGNTQFNVVRDLILHYASLLKPSHGSAGLTTIMDPASVDRDAPYVYSTLQRYLGIDFQEPIMFSMTAENAFNRLKSINWITVLGDEIVNELGGIDIIKKNLTPECLIIPYSGGVMIQAGELPQLFDITIEGVSTTYRSVAKLTKPVRFVDYKDPLFEVFEPLDGVEETMKWISRFD